jgi:hypothetical protein
MGYQKLLAISNNCHKDAVKQFAMIADIQIYICSYKIMTYHFYIFMHIHKLIQCEGRLVDI